jgi:hypothetical protein
MGTVVVAEEPQPGSTAFTAVPEDYESLKTVLVSEQRRNAGKPYSYYLAFKYTDIGTLIESVT